jgi:hypothetical protein
MVASARLTAIPAAVNSQRLQPPEQGKKQRFCVAAKTWVWIKTVVLTAKPVSFQKRST